MKKIYLALLLIIAVSATGFTQVCTTDPNAVGLVYPMLPDSIVNPGETYNQTMTVTVPTDTTISVVTVHIDSIKLASITGMPVGLSFQCNSTLGTCTYPGGTQGCFIINGTVNDTVGVYPILFDVIVYGLLDLDTVELPYSLDVFTLYVGNVGIQTLNTSKFDVIQNIPNPFSGTTTIKFNSPTSETVTFYVFDMLGRAVHSSKINAVSGVNSINYSAEKLAPGTYFYTIANGKTRITKRMIVSGK